MKDGTDGGANASSDESQFMGYEPERESMNTYIYLYYVLYKNKIKIKYVKLEIHHIHMVFISSFSICNDFTFFFTLKTE